MAWRAGFGRRSPFSQRTHRRSGRKDRRLVRRRLCRGVGGRSQAGNGHHLSFARRCANKDRRRNPRRHPNRARLFVSGRGVVSIVGKWGGLFVIGSIRYLGIGDTLVGRKLHPTICPDSWLCRVHVFSGLHALHVLHARRVTRGLAGRWSMGLSSTISRFIPTSGMRWRRYAVPVRIGLDSCRRAACTTWCGRLACMLCGQLAPPSWNGIRRSEFATFHHSLPIRRELTAQPSLWLGRRIAPMIG